MTGITFRYEAEGYRGPFDESNQPVEIEYHVGPDATLPDILRNFDRFLRACGYGPPEVDDMLAYIPFDGRPRQSLAERLDDILQVVEPEEEPVGPTKKRKRAAR